MITITANQAIAALREVVAETGPEHVANYYSWTGNPGETATCRYAYQRQPDCIVGRALVRCGMTAEQVATLDLSTNGDFDAVHCASHAFAERLRRQGFALETRAIAVLKTAQGVQDHQILPDHSFGAALAAAEAFYESGETQWR